MSVQAHSRAVFELLTSLPIPSNSAWLKSWMQCYLVNLAIFVPHVGHVALNMGFPFDVTSLVIPLSSMLSFFLHLTQYID